MTEQRTAVTRRTRRRKLVRFVDLRRRPVRGFSLAWIAKASIRSVICLAIKGSCTSTAIPRFNGLFGDDKGSEQACVVHARRKFVKVYERESSAIAEEAINRIAALYAVKKRGALQVR